MIGALKAASRKKLASQCAEAALHTVSDNRAADLFGNGVTNAHRRIAVAAGAHQQHEPGHGRALTRIGGQEIGAPAEGGENGNGAQDAAGA